MKRQISFNIKQLVGATLLLLAVVVGGSLLTPKAAEAAAPKCYGQVQRNGSAVIVQTAQCSYNAFEAAGFKMGSLPKPLQPDKCYFWSDIDSPGRVVECNEPRFRNASPYGGPLGSGAGSAVGGAGDGSITPSGSGALDDPSPQDVSDCDGGSCINDNYIVIMAKWAINILSAVVGVVVVAVIVFAGIEYSSSGGDPNRTAAAKSRIINAIVALAAYMFLYIILQWLIPGGLFA